MTIKYHWEHVLCNVVDKDTLEPSTHQEYKDIDYDYDRDVKVEDLVAYLMPHIAHKKDKTREEINELQFANFYMTKAIDFMLEHGIDTTDFEIALEDDQDFVEFMHDRYGYEAFAEWDEYYNEEY